MNYIYPLSTDQRKYRGDALEKLRKYRDKYLDDLPEKRLLPEDPNYNFYKCRINFISALSLRLVLLIRKWFISEDPVLDDYFDYVDKRVEARSDLSVEEDRTTPEWIALINKTLSHAIRTLESTPSA